jgi:hypothetical protein
MPTNNSEDNKLNDLECRFQLAANGMFNRVQKSQFELFLGHYPDLNQKELIVCHMVIATMWDFVDTYYDAIVSTTFDYYNEVFSDEKEVEYTIKNLIEKGVLKSKIYFLHAKPPPDVPYCGSTIGDDVICQKRVLQPRKFIDFANADIQHEGWMIRSKEFSGAVNAAFGPNPSEDSIKIEKEYYKNI